MSGNGITEQDRVRARHHMGYLNVAEAATFVLGTPAGVETQFVIDAAFDKVLVSAVPLFRQILARLDRIEAQKDEDLELLAVEQIGSIRVNSEEQKKLDEEYEKQRGKLANLLGVPVNPFDKQGGSGGINVPVLHF